MPKNQSPFPVEIEIDFDNPPSLSDEPLSGLELEAKAHWERFRPNLVRQLKAKGPQAFDRAIRRAYWNQEYGIGLTLARNPDLHRDQVEELFRVELFPPPEP